MHQKSKMVTTESIGRGQSIHRSYPMDNQNPDFVDHAMMGYPAKGGGDNIKHSLSGATAVGEESLGILSKEHVNKL